LDGQRGGGYVKVNDTSGEKAKDVKKGLCRRKQRGMRGRSNGKKKESRKHGNVTSMKNHRKKAQLRKHRAKQVGSKGAAGSKKGPCGNDIEKRRQTKKEGGTCSGNTDKGKGPTEQAIIQENLEDSQETYSQENK